MTRYVVSLRTVVTREVEIEAETPEEAVSLAAQFHSAPLDQPVLRPEAVETLDEDPDGAWYLVGACEVCQKPLLLAESTQPARYVSAGEDTDLCLACAAVWEAGEAAQGGGE